MALIAWNDLSGARIPKMFRFLFLALFFRSIVFGCKVFQHT